MTKEEVRTLWNDLQRKLGFECLSQPLKQAGWTFEFDRAKTRFGAMKPSKKKVTISGVLLDNGLSKEVIEDTLRHEIAHVLDYYSRSKTDHGPKWKRWARRCGADPTRTGHMPDEVKPDYRWWLFCPECEEKVTGYHRKPKMPKGHKPCGSKLELRKGPDHPDTKDFE